jgi:DENN (AEX-3) domain
MPSYHSTRALTPNTDSSDCNLWHAALVTAIAVVVHSTASTAAADLSSQYLYTHMPNTNTKQEVQYRMGASELLFTCPPPNKPIAWSALPFETLFQCLDNDNVVTVFECLLLERSVLFKSSQLFLLTAVAEVLTTLLYPLSWTHVYIPVLPEPLLGVLGAPMPFVVGVHTAWMEGRENDSEYLYYTTIYVIIYSLLYYCKFAVSKTSQVLLTRI